MRDTKTPSDGEVALMYSGGGDTTLAAAILAKQYKRVHLVTLCNGLCMRLDRSAKHVRKLKEIFGEKQFVHKTIYITDLLYQIRGSLLRFSLQQHRSPLLFDLCCKLAMETAMIIYCLENNINLSADGNNSAQGEIFLQQSEYLKAVDTFFETFNIKLIHPVYPISSRRKRDIELRNLGVCDGNRTLTFLGISSQFFNQPFCLRASITFFFTSWVRHLPFIKRSTLLSKDAISLRANLEPMAKRYISNYFNEKQKNYCFIILPVNQKSFAAVADLKRNVKKIEVVPKPKNLSRCGIMLRLNLADREETIALLNKHKIDWNLI